MQIKIHNNNNTNTQYNCKYTIQIQIHNTNTNTQYKYKCRRTPFFRYEPFINFWLRFFDTRIETILTTLNIPNAQLILWCLRSLSVKICNSPTTYLNGRQFNSLRPNGRELIYLPPWQKLNYLPAWSNIILQLHAQTSTSQHHGRTPNSQHHGRTSTESFSKPSKFSAHLFWAWRHPHSSVISCLGFIITGDCHILWARA